MNHTKYTVTAHLEVPVELDAERHPAELVRAVTQKLERGLGEHVDPQDWLSLDGGRITDAVKVTGIVVRHSNGAVVVTSGTAVEQ